MPDPRDEYHETTRFFRTVLPTVLVHVTASRDGDWMHAELLDLSALAHTPGDRPTILAQLWRTKIGELEEFPQADLVSAILDVCPNISRPEAETIARLAFYNWVA